MRRFIWELGDRETQDQLRSGVQPMALQAEFNQRTTSVRSVFNSHDGRWDIFAYPKAVLQDRERKAPRGEPSPCYTW